MYFKCLIDSSVQNKTRLYCKCLTIKAKMASNKLGKSGFKFFATDAVVDQIEPFPDGQGREDSVNYENI